MGFINCSTLKWLLSTHNTFVFFFSLFFSLTLSSPVLKFCPLIMTLLVSTVVIHSLSQVQDFSTQDLPYIMRTNTCQCLPASVPLSLGSLPWSLLSARGTENCGIPHVGRHLGEWRVSRAFSL